MEALIDPSRCEQQRACCWCPRLSRSRLFAVPPAVSTHYLLCCWAWRLLCGDAMVNEMMLASHLMTNDSKNVNVCDSVIFSEAVRRFIHGGRLTRTVRRHDGRQTYTSRSRPFIRRFALRKPSRRPCAVPVEQMYLRRANGRMAFGRN